MTAPGFPAIPNRMRAMVTMGHGGLNQLVYHKDWPCPTPGLGIHPVADALGTAVAVYQ